MMVQIYITETTMSHFVSIFQFYKMKVVCFFSRPTFLQAFLNALLLDLGIYVSQC